MIGLAMSALLQTSLISAAPLSYQDAYAETEKTGKPLVVLIGADWCPACQTMKNSAIPQVAQDGVFSDVSFTFVDADRNPEIAQQVMEGGSIPQLVMFSKAADGWRQERLVGAQSPGAILSFLRRGIKAAGKLLPGNRQ